MIPALAPLTLAIAGAVALASLAQSLIGAVKAWRALIEQKGGQD